MRVVFYNYFVTKDRQTEKESVVVRKREREINSELTNKVCSKF